MVLIFSLLFSYCVYFYQWFITILVKFGSNIVISYFHDYVSSQNQKSGDHKWNFTYLYLSFPFVINLLSKSDRVLWSFRAFRCKIRLRTVVQPMVSSCCQQILGCKACLDAWWLEQGLVCILCRRDNCTVQELKGCDNIIDVLRGNYLTLGFETFRLHQSWG